MEGFVRRGASPHNAQAISNTSRQAMALNAKVTAEDRKATLKPQAQAGIPSRGVSNAQNSSATRQVLQQHQLVHGHGTIHDVYDTDTESLATTANASVLKDENVQAEYPQHEDHGQIESTDGGDDDDDDEEEEGSDEDEAEENEFTQEQLDSISKNGFGNYSHEEKVAFLQHIGLHGGFQTVEGDSYPSTTDGQPTQWDAGPAPPSEEHAHDRGILLPHAVETRQPLYPSTQQSLQHGLANTLGSGHGRQASTRIYQNGAELRDYQRNQRGVHNVQPHTGSMSFNQPPMYVQADSAPMSAMPLYSHNRPNSHVKHKKGGQLLHKRPIGPSHVQLENAKITDQSMPPNHPLIGLSHPQPTTMQQSFQQTSAKESAPCPPEDYEPAKLFAMSYEDLKSETFDQNPRADPQVLGDEILQKGLNERLEFVQKNLDPEKQSKFFSSLSTDEWEEAGDWFLGKFQKIIQGTKAARQNKRKLAQEFEEEVENRYKHISKRQEKLGAAMDKMKQQGEGLVPGSPRLSKSPLPRKR